MGLKSKKPLKSKDLRGFSCTPLAPQDGPTGSGGWTHWLPRMEQFSLVFQHFSKFFIIILFVVGIDLGIILMLQYNTI